MEEHKGPPAEAGREQEGWRGLEKESIKARAADKGPWPLFPLGLLWPAPPSVPDSRATRAGGPPEPLFVLWVIVARLGGGVGRGSCKGSENAA